MDQAGNRGSSYEDPEVLTSESTVAELWQRLPLHLIEDTFGHFELQTGSQLCRVSNGWQSVLSGLALLNRGMVFHRPYRRISWYSTYWNRGLWFMSLLDLYWTNGMFLKKDSVKSFVVLSAIEGEISDERESAIQKTPARFADPGIRNPLTKIVIYKGKMIAKNIEALLQFIRAKRIRTVRFVACDFRVHIASDMVNPSYPIWSHSRYVTWELLLNNVDRLLTADMNRTLAWKRLEYTCAPYLCNRWMLSDFADPQDLTPIFWPHPPEQLLWLKNTLVNLPIPEAQVLDVWAYRAYLTEKRALFPTLPDEKLKKMGILWNGEELDAMDCAFFAKVLNSNANAPTDFPKPPCGFPFDCEWD